MGKKEKLYENIKKHRIRLGLTQEELAHMCGYKNRAMICRIEKGDVDLTQSTIVKLAKIFNITPTELMGYEGINTTASKLEAIVNGADEDMKKELLLYAEYLLNKRK